MYTQTKNPPPSKIKKPSISKKRLEEENNRTLGATAGAAMLGASLAGPAGAVIGGFVGLLLGEWANDEKKKQGHR